MGTAGPLRLASDILDDGSGDPFFVLNRSHPVFCLSFTHPWAVLGAYIASPSPLHASVSFAALAQLLTLLSIYAYHRHMLCVLVMSSLTLCCVTAAMSFAISP